MEVLIIVRAFQDAGIDTDVAVALGLPVPGGDGKTDVGVFVRVFGMDGGDDFTYRQGISLGLIGLEGVVSRG